MNIYRLLSFISGKAPARLKIAGLLAMHIFRRRTIGVFLDPVLACNLRCRMCYFSCEDRRKEMHGKMQPEKLQQVQTSLYHRTLKLQIGCGAEPTLYSDLEGIVVQGRQSGIPYISLTTNGQLIASGKVDLMALVKAGLNEITLSTHGTTKAVYENLMQGASFERFQLLVGILKDVKTSFPEFKIRINYTINSLNIHDLTPEKFWGLWSEVTPDIIQLRPVQKLGETSWSDFNLEPLKENYSSTIAPLIEECRRRGITCIAPTLNQIDEVATSQDYVSSLLEDITYCYVSPTDCYKSDFHLGSDTYETYHSRVKTARRLLSAIFSNHAKSQSRNTSKKLNYKVK